MKCGLWMQSVAYMYGEWKKETDCNTKLKSIKEWQKSEPLNKE